MILMKRFIVLLCLIVWCARATVAQDAQPPAAENTDTPNPAPAPEPAAEPTPAEPAPPVITPQPQNPRSNIPPRGQRRGAPADVKPAPVVVGPGGKQMVGVIDFQGASIQAVLDYYAQSLAHCSLITAPGISTAQVWFRSQTDLTIEEARAALDTVLAINGVQVTPVGDKLLKAVPIQSAKTEGLDFKGEARSRLAGDSLMTQVIQLKYAEPADVVSALQPYMHTYGYLLALPKSGCVLITETAANVNQMLEIVKYIDVPSALKMETRYFVMKHAKSSEVVARLQAIIQEAQQLSGRSGNAGGGAPGSSTPVPTPPINRGNTPHAGASTSGASDDAIIEGKVIISADERTNKIIILSRAGNYPFFERIIEELDAKVDPDVTMKVILLEYASAEDTASLINALISGGSPTLSSRRTSSSSSSQSTTRPTLSSTPPPPIAVGGAGGTATDTGFLQFAQGVRILPDPRTNGLLIMATKEDLARIEQLIKSVDTPVAQVLIEVVIAEVTLNNELDVGVDIFKRLTSTHDVSSVGGTSTDGNSPTQLPGPKDTTSDLLSAVPTAALLGSGAGGLTYFATFRNLNLDVVLHALHSTSRGKVLSTPVIQTMDNQEASILVGSSVPVPVSTVSSVVGNTGTIANNTALNANIEYKDVAIELKVTPRVNPGGYVRMDIEQKVNDLGANVTISGTTVPTILKREAKSSVAVEDKSTVALGGLIKEAKTLTETKVPFFGDIPGLGHLFKSQLNSKVRTELIIFIRPTVMRTDMAAVAEAKRRALMLNAHDDLQLEKHFQRTDDVPPVDQPKPAPVTPNAPAAVPTSVPPSTQGAVTPAPANPAASAESERYAAKVKALQQQAAQPATRP